MPWNSIIPTSAAVSSRCSATPRSRSLTPHRKAHPSHETKDYKVENTKTGETKVISGKELANGVEIALDKRSAAVVFFEAVKD